MKTDPKWGKQAYKITQELEDEVNINSKNISNIEVLIDNMNIPAINNQIAQINQTIGNMQNSLGAIETNKIEKDDFSEDKILSSLSVCCPENDNQTILSYSQSEVCYNSKQKQKNTTNKNLFSVDEQQLKIKKDNINNLPMLSLSQNVAMKSDLPTKTSDLTNDGDGTSEFVTKQFLDSDNFYITKARIDVLFDEIFNEEE